jgi:hypothetical protein
MAMRGAIKILRFVQWPSRWFFRLIEQRISRIEDEIERRRK